MSLRITNDWENHLIEDCKRIVQEAEIGVFKKWHELGNRIKQDQIFLTKKYGDGWYQNLAALIDVSYRSIYRAIEFVDKYPSWNQVEDFVTRDKITWREFATSVLPDSKTKLPFVPLPKDKYRCLVIDPPWPIEKILRHVRPNQVTFDYPTMSLEEIESKPIPDLFSPDGCHIYLWVTHKHLFDGEGLFEKWGIEYECELTWVKNVGFTPFSWMYSTEHVLFGRVGDLDLLKLGERLDFKADVREHSRKPEEFYNLVRRVSPGPRLDMFAREKHEGFDQYGDETAKFGGDMQ